MRVVLLLNFERLEVLRHELFHCRPGQVPIEKVLHVVLRHAIPGDLHLGAIDRLGHFFRDVPLDYIFDFQLLVTVLLALVSPLLRQPFLPCHSLCLLHLDLFNDTWGLFGELLFDIDVLLVVFVHFGVDDLLELVPHLLRHQMRIELLMDQLVPLESLKDDLRVEIVMVGREVDVLGVVDAGAEPGLLVGHERDRFIATRGRSRTRAHSAAHERRSRAPDICVRYSVVLLLE